MKKFVNVTLGILEEDFELAYSVLVDFDVLGMEEKFDTIIVSFDENKWNDDVKKELEDSLKKILPYAKIKNEETILDKNWVEEWEKNVKPIKISDNIYITPEWRQNEIDAKIKIIINPKMSFGTGQHATTKLMAKLTEDVCKPGQVWIDAGTGTGVLAILAAKLGAKKIYAFDNDEWSYENALENAKLNGEDDKIDIALSTIDEYVFPKADVIVANMFFNLIISSLDKFYNSLFDSKGKLLISGILIYDEKELIQKAEESGFKLEQVLHEDEWCGFLFKAIDKNNK